MSLNFDAQINLDVAPFLASIERARGAVKQLNADIDALNKKKITPGGGATPGGTRPGTPGSTVPGRRDDANATMAQANAHDANVRSLARERYALYDVAATYTAVAAISIGAVKKLSDAAIAYERSFADVNRTTNFISIKDQFETVNEAARVMKYSLTQIASEIPVAFSKITEIATIGNQLGIAQGKLEGFSKTVAQFSSLTGMTASATAMGLGRAVELLSDATTKVDFNQFASSIAYAGVNAVATEEQIVSVTKEIATTAKMAKFSAADVVGLATALSSVGVAPEAARGSIIRTFAGINKAVSESGAQLDSYAQIAGMPSEIFAKTWNSNGQEAFDAFLGGLQSMSAGGENLDTVLRSLGLKNVRDIQTIQKLGDNYDVYAEAIGNANKAYGEGTFLTEAYSKIQDTVAAKLELLNNNFTNLQATLGEGVTGEMFKSFIDALNLVLKQLNDAARNPFVRDFVMPLILGLTTLVGVFAAINGVSALARASMLAYATAMGVAKVSADGTTISLQKGAVAAKFFNTALKSVGWLLAIGVIIEGLAILSAELAPIEQKAESMLGGFAGLQDAFTSDTKAMLENAKATGMTAEEYAKANGIILVNTGALEGNDEAAQDAADAHKNTLNIVGLEPTYFGNSTNAIGGQTIAIGQNTVAWIKNALAQSKVVGDISKNQKAVDMLLKAGYDADTALSRTFAGTADSYFSEIKKKLEKDKFIFPGLFNADYVDANFLLGKLKDGIKGSYNEILLLGLGGAEANAAITPEIKDIEEQFKSLGKAAKEVVRTVVDYANDLVGIFKRIDDIDFSKQTALDDIAAGWKKIKDDAKSAQEAIDKANQSIKEITADRGILEYQLNVAVRYGDTKRADAIRAKLEKNTIDLAKANEELVSAQDKSSKSLTGNTEVAAGNRSTMLDMLGKYQEYIKTLAATGSKGTEFENSIKDLKKEFIDQGLALGFNATELDKYSGQFDKYVNTVHNTPRDVTVEFDATKSSEFNAIQEYLAKEHKLFVKVIREEDGTLNSVGSGAAGAGAAPSGAPSGGLPTVNAIDTTAEAKSALSAKITALSADLKVVPSLQGAVIISNQINALKLMLTQLTTAEASLSNKNLSYSAAVGFSNQRANIIKAIAAGNFTGKYADGGLVRGPGGGTTDSIPAMISNGEFVMSAAAVKTYGVDFMNSLNNIKLNRVSVSAGQSLAAGGEQMVYLSPEDRQLLRAAIERPVNLYADSTQIATTANNGNVLLAQRGLN